MTSQYTIIDRRVSRSLLNLLFVLTLGLAGCGSNDAAKIDVQADGIDALPPAQIQRALAQLSAGDARSQKSGLQFVEQFPSLTETHRRLVENLAQSGASDIVKQKASKLLETQTESQP